MELQGWVSIVFVVASSIIDPGSADNRKYLFHIPWACSVMHIPGVKNKPPLVLPRGTLIGACAILEPNKVLVSADTFTEMLSNSTKRFYEVMHEVFVQAGSNFMDAARTPQRPPHYMQTIKVNYFVVAFKPPQANGRWYFKRNPHDISKKAVAEFDAYGLAFAVGILTLEGSFGRSPYVVPMLIKGPDIPGRTREFRKRQEEPFLPNGTCITYSWNNELNKIRYHEVSYLQTRQCQKAYCYWNLGKCGQFPQKDYLACFKSVKFADVCPNAGGAALYCPKFSNSVFAILTTAPSCGLRNTPGVYTTLPMIIDLFEEVFKVKFEPEKRISYNLYSLPQWNNDYPGILE